MAETLQSVLTFFKTKMASTAKTFSITREQATIIQPLLQKAVDAAAPAPVPTQPTPTVPPVVVETKPAPTTWGDPAAAIHIDIVNKRVMTSGTAGVFSDYLVPRVGPPGWVVQPLLKAFMARGSGTVVARTSGGSGAIAGFYSTDDSPYAWEVLAGKSQLRTAGDIDFIGAIPVDLKQNLGTGWSWGASGQSTAANAGGTSATGELRKPLGAKNAYLGNVCYGDRPWDGVFQELLCYADTDRLVGSAMAARCVPLGGVVTPPAPLPPPSTDNPFGLALKFSEDFKTLDMWHKTKNPGGRWKPQFNFGNQDNGDSRVYGDAAQPWAVTDSNYAPDIPSPFAIVPTGLEITLRANPNPSDPRFQAYGKSPKYLGGVLTTETSYNPLYGYFEAVMTLNDKRGSFPAFWMLNGTNYDEIDIMEQLGVNPGRVFMTGHKPSAGQNTNNPWFDGLDVTVPHAFGCRWTANELVWFIDRQEKARATFALNTPQFLLVNQVCGGWDANDTGIIAPSKIIVHSVRAWQ